MTAFGTLYYTDCRPGQGLLGGAGFQFQASSPGVPAQATELVQRAALYEPPVAWMRARRPVAEYPPSLTHCRDGDVFATAAGCYLGREANGTREGNQFTHAIVTTDPDSYGLVRPAQLWDAPWWVTAPAATTSLDAMTAPPRAGRWTASTVRDRTADAPDGEAWLVALLSALHRLDGPDRRPVIVVTDDPALAACWIAAATLLLPRADALRIGFKIFAPDVQSSRHDVVALHPDWAGPWAATHSDSGFLVFDLVHGRHSAVPATDAARFWVPRFLDADPYDVVEAVEYAGRFASSRPAGREAPDAAVDRVAGAVLAIGEPIATPADTHAMAAWLATTTVDVDSAALERLVDAVLSAGADDVATLRNVGSAVGRRGTPALVVRISSAILRAELAEVLAAPGRAGVDLVASYPPLSLTTDGPDRLPALEAELARARPDQVGGLLSLATRHRLRPSTAASSAALQRFARWWISRPDAVTYQPGWILAREVLDAVRDVLAENLADPRAADATVRTIDRRWRGLLWPTVVYPGDPLDSCLCGLAYRDAAPASRPSVLRTVLEHATTEDGDAGAVTFRAVFRFRAAEGVLEEVSDLLAALHERSHQVSAQLADTVVAAIHRSGRSPSTTALDVLRRLVVAGCRLPESIAGWNDHDELLATLIGQITRASGATAGRELGVEVGQVDTTVMKRRATPVADAVLTCPSRTTVALLTSAPAAHRAVILDEIRSRWPAADKPVDPGAARAVAVAFLVVQSKATALDAERARLKLPLSVLGRALTRKGRTAVDRAYEPSRLGSSWWEWLRSLDRGERATPDRGRGWPLGRRRSTDE